MCVFVSDRKIKMRMFQSKARRKAAKRAPQGRSRCTEHISNLYHLRESDMKVPRIDE